MDTLKLPFSKNAFVGENKICCYLLDLTNKKGKSKAKFFINKGFTLERWQEFKKVLIIQGQHNYLSKNHTQTPYGAKYQVDCNCPTPDNSNPCIRTVWEIKNEEKKPRLITAHPLRYKLKGE